MEKTSDSRRRSRTSGTPSSSSSTSSVTSRSGTFRYGDHFPESPNAAGDSSLVTLEEYADAYIKSCGGLAANTRAQYRCATDFWLKRLGAGTPMSRLTHSMLRSELGSYPWKGPEHHNNFLIPLRGIMALWVADDRKHRADPLENTANRRRARGSERVTRADAFTEAQEKRLLRDFDDFAVEPSVINYFDFSFATGLRPEEEIEMKWADLFLDLARPHLYVTRVRSLGEVRVPKNQELRKVELSLRAVRCLQRQAAITRARADDYVFTNPVTTLPWNSTASQRDNYWNPAIKRAGLPKLTPYSARHTRATRMLMAGCKPAWCAKQLGHTTEMFFRVYADWLDADDDGGELRKVDGAEAGPAD